MLRNPTHSTRTPAYTTGAAVLFGAAVVILTALGFQYFGGYNPCPLCLEQRYAYYAAIPLLFIALVLISAQRKGAATAVFTLVALAFVANAVLAGYHAGVEWKLWLGPETCSGTAAPLGKGGGGILKDLQGTRVLRCDEAPWTLFGLSLAGWNVLACIVLAVGAASAALRTSRD